MKLIFVCCNKERRGRYCGKWWFNDKWIMLIQFLILSFR
jgi:hypothetical protein